MEPTVSKCEETNEEDILQRHKKEKKELQSKITSMKHSVAKTDKKGKKEMTATIAKLELDLEQHHENELEEFRRSSKLKEDEIGVSPSVNGTIIENGIVNDETVDNQTRRVTRAQKRREKKETNAKTRQRLLEEAGIEGKTSERQTEKRLFKPILAERGLKLVEIWADGDCMYNAVAHQLSLCGLEYDAQHMRELTAKTIRKHKNEFLPFLLFGDEEDVLSDDQFETYCNKIVKTTVWGGQPELKALSMGVRRRIEVLQANGAPIIVGDDVATVEKPLVITYHRHAYRLGEHYNSTEMKSSLNDTSSDSE